MTPKIALVTGANRGIGLEVSRRLAEQGMFVILSGRDATAVEAATRSLERAGLAVAGLQLDVSDALSIDAAAAHVNRAYGRLDVLVNNAAVYPDAGVSVFEVPLDAVQRAMATNLYGPLALCQAFVPGMIRRDYGRVVNVSSGAGALDNTRSTTTAYALSKVALNALTRMVAAGARGHNVKVNAVNPGWVRTDMGGPGAPRSVEQGADTIIWLAALADDGPTGGFFSDRRPIAW